MWVALIAVGPTELAASNAPIALVFERLTGASPRVMSAIAIVATLNGIVVNIIMASRIMYGLSRQGVLPQAFGQISSTTQTPLLSTAASVAIVLFFSLLLPIAQLADLSARITLAMFSLINLALLRIKMRDDPNPMTPTPRASSGARGGCRSPAYSVVCSLFSLISWSWPAQTAPALSKPTHCRGGDARVAARYPLPSPRSQTPVRRTFSAWSHWSRAPPHGSL